MMLSPAVVGVFWKYIYQPQAGLFNYIVNAIHNFGEFTMIGNVSLAPWSIIIVDTWMWTPFVMLMCLAGLRSIPEYLTKPRKLTVPVNGSNLSISPSLPCCPS